jgi:septation ring formation regulator EzrA
MQQSVQQDMSSLKDRIAQDEKTNTDLRGDLTVVTKKLRITQGQLKTARQEAAKLNDEATQKISALDTSVHTELATKAATDDVKNVDTKVTKVSTDLDATREDLKMAKSEMGTLSCAVSASATTSSSPLLAETNRKRWAMSPSS